MALHCMATSTSWQHQHQQSKRDTYSSLSSRSGSSSSIFFGTAFIPSFYLLTIPALHMSSRAATEVSSALTLTKQDTASLPMVLQGFREKKEAQRRKSVDATVSMQGRHSLQREGQETLHHFEKQIKREEH